MRLVLLFFWTTINIVISLLIIWKFETLTHMEGLLGQVIVNNLFVIVTYIILKSYCKEKITPLTIVAILLAVAVFGIAIYFFVQKTKNDETSPANSRKLNRPCKIADFYDEHDLWHFFSSVGLFLCLMIVMTLDDRLMTRPEDMSKVFRVVKEDPHRPVTVFGEV